MRRLGILAAILFLLGACNAATSAPTPGGGGGCVVDRVIDGDTIVVGGCEDAAHVRLLLINTPEVVHPGLATDECGGAEARAYVESRLPPGTPIRLQAGVRDKDQYGRLLRYVWIGDELLNETLVQKGYAERYRDAEDHTYEARIIAAEQSAKARNVGIWANCR